MSAYGLDEFLAYWENEGQTYTRAGDYDWMASLVPGRRILEIGCGLGFGTRALLARGLSVFSLDSLPACLAATQEKNRDDERLVLLQADVAALDAVQRAQIEAFAPEAVVCWLMGAPDEISGARLGDGGRAVVAYREKTHRAVAELAASLPSVQALHLVDRTAIPWQAKDIGRDTLVGYHLGKTLRDLPFGTERRHALYRKLGEGSPRNLHPALKGAVPTLASLLAERKQ